MNPTGYISRDADPSGNLVEEVKWEMPSNQNKWIATPGMNGEIMVTYDLVARLQSLST